MPPETPSGRPPVSSSAGAFEGSTSNSAYAVWSSLPAITEPSVGSVTSIRAMSGNAAPSWTMLEAVFHSAELAARLWNSYEKPGPLARRIALS